MSLPRYVRIRFISLPTARGWDEKVKARSFWPPYLLLVRRVVCFLGQMSGDLEELRAWRWRKALRMRDPTHPHVTECCVNANAKAKVSIARTVWAFWNLHCQEALLSIVNSIVVGPGNQLLSVQRLKLDCVLQREWGLKISAALIYCLGIGFRFLRDWILFEVSLTHTNRKSRSGVAPSLRALCSTLDGWRGRRSWSLYCPVYTQSSLSRMKQKRVGDLIKMMTAKFTWKIQKKRKHAIPKRHVSCLGLAWARLPVKRDGVGPCHAWGSVQYNFTQYEELCFS